MLDKLGMPLGRIVHSCDGNEAAPTNAHFDEGMRLAKAAGTRHQAPGKYGRAAPCSPPTI